MTPLVLLDKLVGADVAPNKSPKSVEFPVEEIVMYWITLSALGAPPPENTPLVEDAHPAKRYLADAKSPKSVALPVDVILKYWIIFILPELSRPPA